MANDELEAIFELGEEQEFDCEFKIDATTFDYSALDNKPQINGETLEGNKLSSDLHLASEQGLLDEIENRQNADIEFANNLSELDSKVDGINANLTQQIEETQQDVNDKYNELIRDIDDLTDVVEEDYNALDTKINTTTTTINKRITDVADDLQQTIEENVVALQQEDAALQNQINTHSTMLTAYDTRITNNTNAITQEVTNRQNADDTLQDQIDNLKARGRFLSLWNATTGLAETNPEIDPYPYNTGDYFIVGTVGEVNYKPTGTQYVIGQPSTVIETEELATEDVYYFDGQVWHLQVNHGKTVSFGNLAGQPSDNIALKQALDSKQDVITDLDTYVKNTDYASGSVGGVVKTSGTYSVNTSGNGYLQALVITKEWYDSINTSSFISKGTLENIKESLVTSVGDTKYQPTLVSGTNIKTLNNESLLGEGNIDITSAQWGNITGDISNQTDLQTALDNKTQVIIRSW